MVRLSSILCLLLLLSPLARAAPKSNILFIMADDLGYGDLSCYGAPDVETPHLDQLAVEGIRFIDFYANAPTCSPTRMAFLTGRYQQRLGMENALKYQEMGTGLPEDGKTIAHALQSADYITGLSGKWHLGYDELRKPLQQGFDHFFGVLGGNHHYFQHMDRIGVHDLWDGNDPVHRDGIYSTDLITEDAIGFLKAQGEQPFFLFLSHVAPHFPYQGPGDADKDVRPKTREWQSGDRETCAAMIEHMDAGIGRVLQTLEELGMRENTLVIFTSDNGGPELGRNLPLRGEKSEIWEGGIRVPCIVRWPGVLPAGKTTDQVAITMDWTVTFRRLAGLDPDPVGEDGIDLLPLLTGDAEPMDRTLFWRRKDDASRKVKNPGRAVRDGSWKLLEHHDGESLLFDLADDPGEQVNRLKEFPERTAKLREKLDAWEAEMDR